MPLSFLTKSQQFVFVDPSTTPPATVNPEAVQPNHLYDVYVVIQNTDSFEATNVHVNVSHSAFGIGLQGGTSGLTQPAPVNVPPEAYGIPGTATVSFTFQTPAGGHGCLGAEIVSDSASVGQNVTVISCASGVPSTLSFVVFGGTTAESMVLTLTESIQNGAVVPPGSAQSWKPLLVAPPGTGPAVPTPAPITLNLAANAFYSVGLQVTIPSGATQAHVFRVVGTVAGVFEGEVDIVVQPVAGLAAPNPYITGGYQSPDILLFDSANHAVPEGGEPDGDTLLLPNTNYKVSAVVHNSSSTPATNTTVRFWQIPGGVATNGTLIDVVTVTVPANGSVQVDSAHPFVSAPPGEHRCAAVSIYNSQSPDATVDPVTAAEIPDPDTDVAHSASGWRNTDSMFVLAGKPWNLVLQGTLLRDARVPVTVAVKASLAAANLENTPAAAKVVRTMQQAGARSSLPVFLIPAVRATLPSVDLGIQVGPIKAIEASVAEFSVSGVIPADANPGDRYLVEVSAKYDDRTVDSLRRCM